uniref:Putative tail length tape measure protein n=2 Tax=viral metagenome TaxID=1070528 RepID=A0A6H1ZCQ1_9ZZZZ
MTDLATLGIRVEAQEVATADQHLDNLTASAARAEKSVDGLAAAARRADGATSTMNVAVRHQQQVMTASRNAMGLTTAEGLNLSRQFADIGVTAAMGMNPLMIALQQGPQLLDIFQMAAIRTGTTVRATMAAAAAAMATALAPFLPIIAAAGIAIGATAAAWGLATRSMSNDVGDLTKSMGLNEDQLKRLKDENVSTTITAGDAWRGLGTTIKEVFQETFGDELKWVSERWNEFMTFAGKAALAAAAGIGAAFIGTYNVIRNNWRSLPAVIGDAAITAANIAIRAVEGIVNAGIAGLNKLIQGARGLSAINPAFRLAGGMGDIGNVSFGRIDNPFAGAAATLGTNAAGEYVASFQQNLQAMAGFYERWMDNAEASGRARIRKAAGEAGDGNSARAERGPRETLQPFSRVDIDPFVVRVADLVNPLRLIADELQLIDGLARETAQGLASAFGESGRALGDLLTTMTAYQSRMAEINLAESEGRRSAMQAERDRTTAQIANYGDMLGAAKGFFAEGSDGYRALQAAEAAYRVFQFAMSVQAMAMGAAETSAHVAQSGVKAAASTTAGAANIFEKLGPFGFPVVAAMLAVLASLGMKGKGGGGGSTSSVDASVSTSQGYSQQASAVQDSFAASVAQRVEVKVTADRDGLNAYVAQTARQEAAPMVAQGMAAASGATRAQVFADLDKSRTYGRGG